MKIWKLGIEFGNFKTYMITEKDKEKCEKLASCINLGKKTSNAFDGEEIVVYDGDIKADFSHVWGIGNQVLNENAKNVLNDTLENNAELVVMQAEEEKLYLLNVFNIIDVLNHELSEIRYTPTGPAIEVKKYEFKAELVGKNDIFKIYLEGRVYPCDVFVSDKFKRIVEENNLTGFSFTEVWEG